MFKPGCSYKRLVTPAEGSPVLEDWTYLGWDGADMSMGWQGPGGEIHWVTPDELEVTVEW